MKRENARSTRREFIKTAAAAAAASTALAANLGALRSVHAAGNDVLKVGLIGCGKRGCGAAENAVKAAPNVQIVALGDAFQDQVDDANHSIKSLRKIGAAFAVKDDHRFFGLDAYQKVIDSGVDLVILATPPGFRPLHLEAAVKAGKHIFAEKPVAVDATGVRKCLAVYEEAKKKNLGIGVGTMRRHEKGYLEVLKRVEDGAIGDVVAARCYYNTGFLWEKPRTKSMSDLEWQVRNWLYFTWLSGDHIVEQHVHDIDVLNWFLKAHPLKASGMGGRQVRTSPTNGHIFDHFAIEYEYPKGIHALSMCRQIKDCQHKIGETLVGSKGSCWTDYNGRIFTINGKVIVDRKSDNTPYVQEHIDLIESIRKGQPINELKDVTDSTLSAIMGRMAAYTGKEVTWEAAMKSKEDTMPAKLSWDMSLPVAPVAIPGKTPLV